jgi:RNA polymerase sigma-70 factor (ECF subfamily)
MDRVDLADALPEAVPGLLRFTRSLVRDPQQAEDLAQETIVRALERADSFRGEARLATWLHRIAHNLAVDRSRRSREVPVDDLADEVEALWRDDAYTVDAGEVVARAETRAELEDALIRLPVSYRAAVVLHDAEGLTVAEIADIAQISLPAAKQRLRRGRMMLVSALARGRERRAALPAVPLRCWDARSQVSDYLDGLLAPDQARRVEKHLEGCPTCPPLYAALVGATDALARTRGTARDPNDVVPSDQAARILGTVEASVPLSDAQPSHHNPATDRDERLADEAASGSTGIA